MKCYEITFSPTGGTQKAADLLTKELSGECTAVDLTKQDAISPQLRLLRRIWR